MLLKHLNNGNCKKNNTLDRKFIEAFVDFKNFQSNIYFFVLVNPCFVCLLRHRSGESEINSLFREFSTVRIIRREDIADDVRRLGK